MKKKLFFLAICFTIFANNCMKENIKRERVGNTSLVMYDQTSVYLFSKQTLVPTCLDGVKKAGAKQIVSANGGTADGITGSTNTASTTKACSAVGID